MKVERFSVGAERNPWRKHIAISYHYNYVALQTSFLYTAKVSWEPVLFADIPCLCEIYCEYDYIAMYYWFLNEVAIELARFNSLLPLLLCAGTENCAGEWELFVT